MRLGDYILPNLSRLSTSLLQEQALQFLREHVVTAFKWLTEKNRRIHRIMTSCNSGQGSSRNLMIDCHDTSSNTKQHIQRVDSHHSSSNAEQTIQFYSASDTLHTSRPLVTKRDGINYSGNLCNGYVSN